MLAPEKEFTLASRERGGGLGGRCAVIFLCSNDIVRFRDCSFSSHDLFFIQRCLSSYNMVCVVQNVFDRIVLLGYKNVFIVLRSVIPHRCVSSWHVVRFV